MLYSVESLLPGQSSSGELTHVDAAGPGQAAEIALGEKLVLAGQNDQLRCRVWWLDEQFQTRSMPLYLPEVPPGVSA